MYLKDRCPRTGVENRAFNLMGVLLLGLFTQGCIVWPYNDTPAVSGTVIEAVTSQPVSNAKVGFRKHQRIDTRTALDGSFHLSASHKWRPCFILPAELGWSSGAFFVEAPGYIPCERAVDSREGVPIFLAQPIALEKNSR